MRDIKELATPPNNRTICDFKQLFIFHKIGDDCSYLVDLTSVARLHLCAHFVLNAK
jgi:hypothetical protein